MINLIKNLERRLRAELPSAKIELHCFDKGGAMLDVIICKRLFVLEYQPEGFEPASCLFGVSEARDDQAFSPAHDAYYERFEDAEIRLRELARRA